MKYIHCLQCTSCHTQSDRTLEYECHEVAGWWCNYCHSNKAQLTKIVPIKSPDVVAQKVFLELFERMRLI